MALKLGVVASRDGGGVKTTAHMSWRRAARPHFTGTRDCGDEMTCCPTKQVNLTVRTTRKCQIRLLI